MPEIPPIFIHVENLSPFTPLPSSDFFEAWCRYVLETLNHPGEVYIGLITPEEIQKINFTYRHQNKPTNVLSFPFTAPPGIKTSTLGDLLICPEIIAKEAKEQGKKLDHHFAHIVTHGTLHLLGYDHELEQEAVIMEKLEIKLLEHWNIPDPYRDLTGDLNKDVNRDLI